ncbi:MAG: NADH-quinone oxidoreductase subunit J [Coriobacteriia bacterium]
MSDVLFFLLAAAALVGALVVVFTRDIMRLVLGLGTFLLSVAGFYLFYGATFLAIAQIFLYVGGVLVLVVIAIMTVHRTPDDEPVLTNRRSYGALLVSAGVFGLLVNGLGGQVPATSAPVSGAGIQALGDMLLGALLPHFEIIGGLLLAGLVVVLAITGGERE